MALSIPGGLDALEDVHGLPRGTVAAIGSEAAAQVAMWIQAGQITVTPEGKFAAAAFDEHLRFRYEGVVCDRPAKGAVLSIEMVDVEGTILREIAEPQMTRDDVALTYAFGLRSSEEIDWPKVNQAIMDRWSLSVLGYIKERAWKLVAG